MLNIEDFEILEFPADLPGLDKVLLWNIYDIAAKWGTIDPENESIHFLHRMADARMLRIFVSMIEKPAISILTAPVAPTFTISIKNEGTIWWDIFLSSVQAKEACGGIDFFAQSTGLINPKTKERKRQLHFAKPFAQAKTQDHFSPELWERMMNI